MTQRTPTLKKLALLLASVCCALLGVELYFRTLRPIEFMRIKPMDADARGGWYGMIHRPASTPGLTYELVPNLDQKSVGIQVHTNSLGMRDDEPLPRDTPGLLRVLALGDSVTFGFRVAQENDFCSVLEREFAAEPLDGRRVEVLNAGVSGYSSMDEAAAYTGKWLALEPDLLVLSYCLNDPEYLPRQPLQRYFVPPHWWQHSSLLRFLVQRNEGRKVRELGHGNYWRALHAPGEAAWKTVEAAFARIAAASSEKHIPVLLTIFPMFSPDPWDKYAYREQHAQVAEAGRRNGFLVLDLLPRFEREAPESVLIDRNDSHPNAGGHRIAAEEIRRFMLEHSEQLLERR